MAVSHRPPAPAQTPSQAPAGPRKGPASTAVYVFGSGDCGQLALGEDVLSAERPIRHPFFQDKDIAAVAAGGLHSLALDRAGRVWSWGCNDEKALGHEHPEFTVGPVAGLEVAGRVVQIACGDSISAVLTEAGEIWTWGAFRDSKGLLGHSQGNTEVQDRPVRLAGLERLQIVQLAAGANHLMALTAEGDVFAWGAGEQGQLGRRVLERHKLRALRPTNVTPRGPRGRPAHIARLSCGAYHTLALAADGTVYASGLNNYGQLGMGDYSERITAEPIDPSAWQGQRILHLTAGEHHSLALSETGHVFAFGRNDSGQCGIPDGIDTALRPPIPSPLPIPNLAGVTMIASGSNHSLALGGNNTVFSWGYGEMHQLGHGREEDSPAPTPLSPAVFGGGQILQVSAGGQHSVVLVGFGMQ